MKGILIAALILAASVPSFVLSPANATISDSTASAASTSASAPKPITSNGTLSETLPKAVSDFLPPSSDGFAHNCVIPPLAIRLGISGQVILDYKIEQDGTVKNVTVLLTSGDSILDQTAERCVTAWTYKPATQNGQPVESSFRAAINFGAGSYSRSSASEIQDAAFPPHVVNDHDCFGWHPYRPKGMKPVLVTLTIKADGSTKDVSLSNGTGDPAIDTDAIRCISNSIYEPAMRNGTPVEVQWTQALY